MATSRRKKRARRRAKDEGSYTCPSCGETIVIPLDISAGTDQSYGEDCPVCCRPIRISVRIDDDGRSAQVWAEAE